MFPTHTEVMWCLDQPLREHHTKKAFLHKNALIGFRAYAYSFKRLALLRL